jgi:hypothetical protein
MHAFPSDNVVRLRDNPSIISDNNQSHRYSKLKTSAHVIYSVFDYSVDAWIQHTVYSLQSTLSHRIGTQSYSPQLRCYDTLDIVTDYGLDLLSKVYICFPLHHVDAMLCEVYLSLYFVHKVQSAFCKDSQLLCIRFPSSY